MSKPRKSVSKAASVLASDDSSADAKSLAGSVLSTSDDEPEFVPGRDVGVADIVLTEDGVNLENIRVEPLEEPMVRFQDEAPFSVETSDPEPTEIVGQYRPDLADSETLEEFPVMTAAELEAEGFGKVIEVGPEPEPVPDHIAEAVAAAGVAAGHIAPVPNPNRD